MLEPVAALGLMLAMALDRVDAKARRHQSSAWFLLLILVAANGWASNRHIEQYWWRYAADLEKLLYEQVYRPNYGRGAKGLVLVVNDSNSASLYEWLVNPLGQFVPGRVPLLNDLMSPTIETFKAIPFEQFSLAGSDPSATLTYRLDFDQGNFTNISERTIEITSVAADSSSDPSHGADKLFDQGRSLDGTTSWMSGEASGAHSVRLNLAQPVLLGSIRIINPTNVSIRELAVELLVRGAWKSVFDQALLDEPAVINARWPDEHAVAVRISIKASLRAGTSTPSAAAGIEEIEFPENRLIGIPTGNP
jgi:hypothetical protein